MQGDLTTLANAKSWLGITSTTDDQALSRLISQVSQVIRAYCSRASFLSKTYNETYDGQGSRFINLRQWPVTNVAALAVGGTSIVAGTYGSNGTPQNSGYFFDAWDGVSAGRPAKLSLLGYSFYEGLQNISVSYTAGYLVAGEAQNINNTDHKVTPLAPYGSWGGDSGVSYASGAAMVAVASAPSVGQYVPPNPFAVSGSTAYYQFSAGDANVPVVLNYSFIPADVENICIELVGERFRYKSRISEKSHSSGGAETVSFLITDLTPWAKMDLQSYKAVVPL